MPNFDDYMSDTPGILSKILVILGIAAFLIADLFGLTLIDILLDEPETFEEGLGNVLGVVFSLFYLLIFAGAGSIFVLLGQIWRQTKILVLPSFLSFGFLLVPIGWLTVISGELGSEMMGLWAFAIVMLLLHFRGLVSTD